MIELAQTNRERVILIGISTYFEGPEDLNDSLAELALLVDTAGGEVVGRLTQDRDKPDPATYIGKGKVEELGELVKNQQIQSVIFDDDLSPAQARNLEKILECKALDRSALILDIFAARAKSMEAKTQVELAQLEYMLPRLTRMWTHLSKQYGGIGTKGPGETQIETDRRMIKTKIAHLKEKLERISQQRTTQRKGRTKHTRAALVGYTNVGKSTLLNLLSGSDVFVENRLFATLDPTTRIVQLSTANQILITDTVGFIKKLPPQLVASFRSTLEEVTEADIIVHLVDISNSRYEEQIVVVNDTLAELGASDKPTLMVFNKIDTLKDRSIINDILRDRPSSVFISAMRGMNILGLKEKLLSLLENEFVEETVRIPQTHQKLIAYVHSNSEILDRLYEESYVEFRIRMRKKDRARIVGTLADAMNIVARTN